MGPQAAIDLHLVGTRSRRCPQVVVVRMDLLGVESVTVIDEVVLLGVAQVVELDSVHLVEQVRDCAR